jgi:hypothetical protein
VTGTSPILHQTRPDYLQAQVQHWKYQAHSVKILPEVGFGHKALAFLGLQRCPIATPCESDWGNLASNPKSPIRILSAEEFTEEQLCCTPILARELDYSPEPVNGHRRSLDRWRRPERERDANRSRSRRPSSIFAVENGRVRHDRWRFA